MRNVAVEAPSARRDSRERFRPQAQDPKEPEVTITPSNLTEGFQITSRFSSGKMLRGASAISGRSWSIHKDGKKLLTCAVLDGFGSWRECLSRVIYWLVGLNLKRFNFRLISYSPCRKFMMFNGESATEAFRSFIARGTCNSGNHHSRKGKDIVRRRAIMRASGKKEESDETVLPAVLSLSLGGVIRLDPLRTVFLEQWTFYKSFGRTSWKYGRWMKA